MKIGISFTLRPDQAVWENGGVQNLIFLYKLFQSSPKVSEVVMVNYSETDLLSPHFGLVELGVKTARLGDVIDHLDVFIEAGAQMHQADAERLHARGAVVIAYRFGVDYVLDLERLLFQRPDGAFVNGTRFDEIWTHPQHVNTSAHYWSTVLRAPVYVLPHIWMPLFIDQAILRTKAANPDFEFGYIPGRNAGKVAVFEPNMNIVKTSIYPMLVCEEAERASMAEGRTVGGAGSKQGELQHVYLTNAQKLAQQQLFAHIVNQLDIFKRGILSSEARYPTHEFLANYASLVVSHQWENGLNYLYYDVLYGGYPLIHNSPFLKEYGYYYPEFDAKQGGQALLFALRHHDGQLSAYRARSQILLSRVHAQNPLNVETHVNRALELVAHKAASQV